MILSELRNYIELHGQATLSDLATRFDSEPSAIQGMLQRWIDKGQIDEQRLTASCGDSCQQCDKNDSLLYVWAGQAKELVEKPIYHLPFHCKG